MCNVTFKFDYLDGSNADFNIQNCEIRISIETIGKMLEHYWDGKGFDVEIVSFHNKLRRAYFSTITHEIVHYLQKVLIGDVLLSKNAEYESSEVNGNGDAYNKYVNTEIELKAHILEFLTKIKVANKVRSWKDVPFDKIVVLLKAQAFFKELLPKNAKKLLSLLYNLYHNL